MYVVVTWRILTDGADQQAIETDVHRALGDLPRCELWPGTALVAARSPKHWHTLAAQFQGLEQVYASQLSFAMFAHTDGDAFLTSEGYDDASAKGIVR